MSEIAKLYENAGIKPTYTDECKMADSYYSMEKDLNERGILFDDYMKQECPNKNEMCHETCPYAYNKEYYPPFTAEKQIALLKLLIRHSKTELYCRYANDKYKLIMYTEDYCTSDIDSFENALVSVVCDVWGLLTPEEKQQVKGILE